jgi:predicted glutamine amidotransferase
MFFAAAGRFRVSHLLDAVLALRDTGTEWGAWGAAYCYGNRLELTRSAVPCYDDPDFRQLAERRTDMMLLVPDNRVGVQAREIQPFSRREARQTWAFCHDGEVTRPGELDTKTRLPDSGSSSEKLFLHLFARIDPQEPVLSTTAALRELHADKGLSCCLVGSEMMVAASWFDSESEYRGLWHGRGELVRYISSQPLRSLPDIEWEPVGTHSVLVVNRTRREIL